MKNNISKTILFASTILVFSGCLKDKGVDSNQYQSLNPGYNYQKIVSIALTTATPYTDSAHYNLQTIGLNIGNDPTVYNFVPITISGGVPAEQDVHVTVTDDVSIINRYNTSFPSLVFDIPATGLYSIVNKNITIPKGQTTAYVQVKLTPSASLLGYNYAIGFKIVSVDGGYSLASVSDPTVGNKSQGIVNFVIKNQYEALYLMTGVRTRYFGSTKASGLRDFFNSSAIYNYATTSATAIQGPLADSGLPVNININGNGSITLTCPVNGTSCFNFGNDPDFTSTYDPISKTYHIYAVYQISSSTGPLRSVDQLLVRQ